VRVGRDRRLTLKTAWSTARSSLGLRPVLKLGATSTSSGWCPCGAIWSAFRATFLEFEKLVEAATMTRSRPSCWSWSASERFHQRRVITRW